MLCPVRTHSDSDPGQLHCNDLARRPPRSCVNAVSIRLRRPRPEPMTIQKVDVSLIRAAGHIICAD